MWVNLDAELGVVAGVVGWVVPMMGLEMFVVRVLPACGILVPSTCVRFPAARW